LSVRNPEGWAQFNWNQEVSSAVGSTQSMSAAELPRNIALISDDIINWTILCEDTSRPYKIISQELAFYREHSIPLPRKHPDQRHSLRIGKRPVHRLYKRACDNPHCLDDRSVETNESVFNLKTAVMAAQTVSVYGPESLRRVYCNRCSREQNTELKVL
jgi:hypothetical protein